MVPICQRSQALPRPRRHLAHTLTVRLADIVDGQDTILFRVIVPWISCGDAAAAIVIAVTVQRFDQLMYGSATERRVGVLEEGAKVAVTRDVLVVVILAIQRDVVVDKPV